MEVTLQQILASRENRAAAQQRLLTEFGKPLVCFTMNIAGPVKTSPLICQGFYMGHAMLQAQFGSYPILFQQLCTEPTGCEAYYIVDAPAQILKELTVQIEDSQSVCRLFDIDVLDESGRKLSRQDLGLSERKCLLCSNSAHVCGRSRAHTVEQLQAETIRLLTDALQKQNASHIATLAQQSLLYEVCTTPKPGLVDCRNNGSHRDMDIFTFMSSAAALHTYFEDCTRIGMETAQHPAPQTFRQLRLPGKLAEREMLHATNGVNTHKGAIFSLGILCGAAGRTGSTVPEDILTECRAMTAGLTAADFSHITAENATTAGQTLYALHGITGVRGQAEAGFPAVAQVGLPVLKTGLQRGHSLNEAGAATLLHLLCAAVDTNIIARSDLSTQQMIVGEISTLLKADPYPCSEVLSHLNTMFVEKNLSPGGSADLLAVTYFLHFLSETSKKSDLK